MKSPKAPPIPPGQLAALGARLSAFCAERGISPAELSRAAGVTDGAVRHYLAGRKAPALGTLLAMAGALATTPGAILGDWPAGEPEPATPAASKRPRKAGAPADSAGNAGALDSPAKPKRGRKPSDKPIEHDYPPHMVGDDAEGEAWAGAFAKPEPATAPKPKRARKPKPSGE